MTLAAFAFYVFAAVTVTSGLLVVVARNPVHSVLWLILAFFSSAGLMVLLGAEFIAMLLIIVYVGAVAVLFLFVVMMLDVDFAALKQGMSKYLPVGALIGAVLIVELGLVLGNWVFAESAAEVRQAAIPAPEDVNNSKALGMILYDRFFYMFQVSGLVLLVAMIGAIVLTLRSREGVKKQDVLAQLYRTREQSVEIRDVKPGEGV
ncbi:MAG: NADH-quinone oxidoreductase subunit J [Pseudomonadota bacterium]